MPSGRMVSPPLGFIDLCARLPAQCVQNRYASESQLEAVRQWASRARWAAVFASTPGTSAGRPAFESERLGPTATIPSPPLLPLGASEAVALPRYRPLTLITQLTAVTGKPRATAALAREQDWTPSITAPEGTARRVAFSSMALAATVPPPNPSFDGTAGGQWNIARYAGAATVEDGPRPIAFRHGRAGPTPAARRVAPASMPALSSLPASPHEVPAQHATRSAGREERAWQPPRFQTDLTMAQLDAINRSINRAVRAVSDQAAFGKAEYWTIPRGDNAVGDCEDYVLAKREALIEAGTPAEALSIAVVRTRRGDLHTVLLVATSTGEVVLDNLSPWIVSWRAAPYSWRQRQARGSALTWIQPDA